MWGIVAEDECNDTYGRCRMYQALKLKYPDEDIPSERTVYRSMEEIELSHRLFLIWKFLQREILLQMLLKR